MLGSLYSAVSGLQSHQTKMNVIGNNIANVNTYGFKGSRVTFSDVFYQTMSAPSGADESTGGTNPSQLGYGATVASVDVMHTQAGSATTDRPLDVYINGDGFLATKATSGQVLFTRVGNMSFDSSGNLVDSNGNMMLGLALDPTTKNPQLSADGTADISNLIPIQIDPEEFKEYKDISIDKTGSILGIKEGDPIVTKGTGTGWMTTATIPTASLYSGKMMMTIDRANSVNFLPETGVIAADVTLPATADVNGEVTISRIPNAITPANYDYTMTYTKIGTTIETTVTATNQLPTATAITFAVANNATPPVNVNVVVNVDDPLTAGDEGVTMPAIDGTKLTIGTVTATTMDLTITTYNKAGETLTLLVDDYTPTTTTDTITAGDFTFIVDGTKLGVLNDQINTTIGSVGPGDSTLEKIGHLAINKFVNSNGLTQSGSGYYLESSNSGEAIATVPGDAGTGALVSGALEMSNVDLSEQFTEMITTQRGFQANTRMITVSDSILEELVNMKR
ncbi:MAG: flagellar hook-basal body complex protein [Eubacteriales bacterium]|nr:flagellar hook-basal body complex protein [Eubacteriales bacterium]MDD3350300.1 flagellar hook-basal body complex protein [Eubacteriales bacterium]